MTEMRLMDADTKKLGVIRRRAETLSDEVSDRLRAAIISRELTPGEHLTEANLAERLGVSKTPVREALMHLVEVGLVESFGGRLHVVRVSTATIRDAYEMRLLLEVESVRLASQRHSEEDSVSLLAAARDTIASANEGVLSEFPPNRRVFTRRSRRAAVTRSLPAPYAMCCTSPRLSGCVTSPGTACASARPITERSSTRSTTGTQLVRSS